MRLADFRISIILLTMVHCGSGLERLFNESRPRGAVRILGVSHAFLSVAGYAQTDITWMSDKKGTYHLALNGGCDNGSLPSGQNPQGIAEAAQTIVSVVAHADLSSGANELDICFTENATGKRDSQRTTLTRDDVPPLSSASIGSGSYGYAIAPALACSDNCDLIVYTTDGSTPAVDCFGNIINGQRFSAAVSLPDVATTTVKFLSVDRAGNIETSVKSETYQVDTVVPIVTAYLDVGVSPYMSPGPNITDFHWDTNVVGMPYAVYYEGACGSPSPLWTGISAATETGSFAGANMTTDGPHDVRICVWNSVGLVGTTTLTFIRDSVPPQTTSNPPGGSYSGVQMVALSCNDPAGCYAIAYTTDGSDPDFNLGYTIINGMEYTGPIVIPAGTTTALKYRSLDNSGNEETVKMDTYTIP